MADPALVKRGLRLVRGLIDLCRRAPVLALAAALAVGIATTCLINAAAAFKQPSGVRVSALRGLSLFSTKPPYKLTRSTAGERRACEAALARVPPASIDNSRAGARLFDQRSVTVADPYKRLVLPVSPDTREFAAFREKDFYATVTLTGVNLAARTATLRLRILPYPLKDKSHARPFPVGTRLWLALDGSLGSGDYPISSAVGEGGGTRVEVGVPLSGAMAAYPQDVYFAALGPAKVRAAIPKRSDSYYGVDFDHPARESGVASEIRAIEVPGVVLLFPHDVACGTRFGFIVERSGGQLFIWLMALVPLLLLLLVVHSLREHWRSGAHAAAGQGAFSAAAATQTGVALLAILSLRAVLVPSEITTVTRVDYVLGAELALLVLCLSLGALMTSRERPPE